MFNYKLTDIATAIGATIKGDGEAAVSSVFIDSRLPAIAPNALFVAINGKQHNGHSYITDLYNNRGVKLFLISQHNIDFSQFPTASFIICNNTLQSLQKLAAWHRAKFAYPVVGITGSNGKTIIKEWAAQLLAPDFSIIRSPKSYNSQVGVPLSVLQMDASHTLGIFEAGISEPNEMANLAPIVAPTIGIFTNIGLAHQENFSSIEAKAAEKIQLFTNVDTLIYCTDHQELCTTISAQTKGSKTFTWGQRAEADVVLSNVSQTNGDTTFRVTYLGREQNVSIPFSDAASLENAMHCLCLMLVVGIDFDDIPLRLAKLTPVAMRLELKEGINSCTIINDSYNSDTGSLSIALDFLIRQKQHPHKLVILSDILQSGSEPEALYREIAQGLSHRGITSIIGIGPVISQHAHLFAGAKEFYQSTAEFMERFSRRSLSNTAILLKGSRPFHFERISALLEKKAHRTVLEVNLNAMVNNLNYFRSLIKPDVKVMVMVKAFSYGSGSYEIASLLQYHRIHYLGVAFADEGIALREAGISLPIIVLNPAWGSYELMVSHNLEPEIYSISCLNDFIATVEKNGMSQYPIHIKLDTGMHRVGFVEDDIDALTKRLASTNAVKVQSIFSHLAASDEPEHDDFTLEQISRYRNMSQMIISSIGYQPIRHILNSAGIERFPQAHFDMIRLGIGLYGVSATHQEKIQTVSTLKTHIAQIKHLAAGETVGYSRRGKLSRSTTTATLPIGYADGLNRKLGNGNGKVLVNGKLAPFIGNVSMDTCVVDITGISANEGDEVTIFGDTPTITQMADAIGTIPYEILTSISQRVKRIYVQE
ncbi:Alanine racemase [anaerobic digester metagenome]